MSASMAELIEAHPGLEWNHQLQRPGRGLRGWWQCVGCKEKVTSGNVATHQADVLAANGYGKLEDAWDECNATDTPWINPYRNTPDNAGND